MPTPVDLPRIWCRRLSITIAGKPVLAGLDLDFQRGTVTALVGRSGCGKSVFLGAITGRRDLELSGDIGRNYSGLGYVYQTPALAPWLSLAENCLLNIRLRHGEVTSNDRARVAAQLTLVGLEDSVDLLPGQASLGMQMRASLARALSGRDVDLLLLDEPFASVDQLGREALQLCLWELAAARPELAVVVVTHDLTEAALLADRIVCLGRRNEAEPSMSLGETSGLRGKLPPTLEAQPDCAPLVLRLRAILGAAC